MLDQRWRALLDDGWTMRGLATHLGVSDDTIKRYVGPLGRRTGPLEYDITSDDTSPPTTAVAAYHATGSEQRAADIFSVSRSVIRRRLYLAGLRDTDFHNR